MSSTSQYVSGSSNSGLPYKVYTALLTQTGTNAPVATVLENTLGGSITWTYDSIGVYFGDLTNGFVGTVPDFRTVGDPVSQGGNYNGIAVKKINSNRVTLYSYVGVDPSDDIITSTMIEIRVYP